MGKYILGLDFEANGLDTDTAEILEIGAVLFDYERMIPVRIFNKLLTHGADFKIDPEVKCITGIQDSDLVKFGIHPIAGVAFLYEMIKETEAIVAHNGFAYDFKLLARELDLSRLETPPVLVDTMIDVPYPASTTSRTLGHLAADHGFAPSPFKHRAVFDVMTMLQILSRYQIPEILKKCESPLVKVVALVDFSESQLARERGFRWNPAPAKRWERVMRECVFEEERGKFPFRTYSNEV